MGNIEWNNIGNKVVIDLGGSFMTAGGDLIFWSSMDSYRAQIYLQKRAITQPTPKMRKPLSAEAIEALNDCTVEGYVIKLGASQLERNVYTEVKGALLGIGGSWKGDKIYGFMFDHDPAELLVELQGGTKRNLKKEFQFFGTPDDLADYIVMLAEIEAGQDILEPSAGQGAICKAIFRELYESHTIWAYELMPQNRDVLDKIIGVRVLGSDFLTECDTSFDRIIANPPFSKNQDIDHIMKMYECLKPGGRLVSIASKHWEQSTNKKELEFVSFLKKVNASIEQIKQGCFKESGTNIATCIIKIER